MSETTKPTIVLVHGAFAESASWNDVIVSLKDQGLEVVAAALGLRGLAEAMAAAQIEVTSGLSPHVLRTTLSWSPAPSGTEGSGRLGTPESSSVMRFSSSETTCSASTGG